MQYLTLAILTVMGMGKSIVFKKIGLSSDSVRKLLMQNMLSFFVASVILIIFSGFNFNALFHISGFSLALSFAFAVCVVLAYVMQTKAMSLGSTSSTVLIYSCGFLIPIIFEFFAYGEKISIVQTFAILLLLVALYLIINPKSSEKISLKWLFFALCSMMGSGLLAILQKFHQNSEFAYEFQSLSVFEFALAGVFSGIMLLFCGKGNCTENNEKISAFAVTLSGAFVGILNMYILKLAGQLPSVILFPVYNVGSLILSGIFGSIIFKEKNSKKGLLGFGIGCFAILLLGLF